MILDNLGRINKCFAIPTSTVRLMLLFGVPSFSHFRFFFWVSVGIETEVWVFIGFGSGDNCWFARESIKYLSRPFIFLFSFLLHFIISTKLICVAGLGYFVCTSNPFQLFLFPPSKRPTWKCLSRCHQQLKRTMTGLKQST